jgi:hypothetical protein
MRSNSPLFARSAPARRAAAILLALAAAMASDGAARASIQAGSSSGYGMSVDVEALGLNLDLGPLPVGAAGSAPGPYNESASVLNALVTTSIPFVVSGTAGAAVVTGTAESNVDGGAGPRFASATGGVVDAAVGVNTLPFLGGGITLLGLDATLQSSASVSGDFGSLSAIGNTTITDLDLVINSIVVDLSAYVNVAVAPNTMVDLSALGILNATLILNEQIIAADNSSIVVNGLRLSLNLIDSITADVILAHSQAQLTATPNAPGGGAVPEPATLLMWSLCGVTTAGLAWVRRRKQSPDRN